MTKSQGHARAARRAAFLRRAGALCVSMLIGFACIAWMAGIRIWILPSNCVVNDLGAVGSRVLVALDSLNGPCEETKDYATLARMRVAIGRFALVDVAASGVGDVKWINDGDPGRLVVSASYREASLEVSGFRIVLDQEARDWAQVDQLEGSDERRYYSSCGKVELWASDGETIYVRCFVQLRDEGGRERWLKAAFRRELE